jgi:hypothetical protein
MLECMFPYLLMFKMLGKSVLSLTISFFIYKVGLILGSGMVANACNPSKLGGRDKRIKVLGQHRQKFS